MRRKILCFPCYEPIIFSYALDEDISIASVAALEDSSTCFALPMSTEAFEEFQVVSDILMSTQVELTRLD
jgi:hypothetical protein